MSTDRYFLLFKSTDVVIVAVIVAGEGKGNMFIFIGCFLLSCVVDVMTFCQKSNKIVKN